eukprot:Skav234088  [mRNA]  locus=scaffold212:124100:133614:- [translate_table: standard]
MRHGAVIAAFLSLCSGVPLPVPPTLSSQGGVLDIELTIERATITLSTGVAGGAALALIVDDVPGTLPAQVENAPEVLMVVMQIDQEMTNRIAQRSGDSWFQISGGTGRETLVNGEVNPTILISAGQWTRFRVIYAGWLAQVLEFNIVGCEMALLAKDCYLEDLRTTAASPNCSCTTQLDREEVNGSSVYVSGSQSPMVLWLLPSQVYEQVSLNYSRDHSVQAQIGCCWGGLLGKDAMH